MYGLSWHADPVVDVGGADPSWLTLVPHGAGADGVEGDAEVLG